jgi:hypothetical protein
MDAFSYLSVLLSIIIGLGLAQVLTACGRLIRNRERVTVYWPPLLWAAVLVVIYVQVWWSMFGMRAYANWSFFTFFVVLLQTVAVYMMAAVVLPEEIGERLDLRDYYQRQSGWFLGFFLATLGLSILKDLLLGGRLPLGANLAFHLLFGVVCVVGLLVRRPRAHELLAVSSAVAIVAYISLLFARLH